MLVASLVGAWIETESSTSVVALDHVAPLVGAWIETFCCHLVAFNIKSHPSWVRGLKHSLTQGLLKSLMSHPSWVRGLKHCLAFRVGG